LSQKNPAIFDTDETIYSEGQFSILVGESADDEMNKALVYKILDTENNVVQMETTVLLNAYQFVTQINEQLEEQYGSSVAGEDSSVLVPDEPEIIH